jgi:prepilin-type N-terminal cleavage/methylation domain-containing protein
VLQQVQQVLSPVQKPQQLSNFIQTKLLKSNKGFTLIEILIAFVLILFVLSIAMSDAFNTSADLDKESDNLERAVRFMSDEAALRNAVVRLHFMLKKAPQEYAIEYGPSDSFILPPESEFENKVLSLEEEEKAAKQTKEINLKFNKVQEFQDSNTEISENVKILGIGNANSQKLMSNGDVSIYSFPTGEKDDALILLANEEKVISLEINPFNSKIEKKSHKIEPVGNRELIDLQNEKAKEIFETWLKDK